MPNLLDELERYLRRWRDDLPTAWRERLGGVAPDFHAIPRDAWLGQDARIVPVRRRSRSGVFYALEGIDPSDVAVVVIGNDPYPDPCRATGRSFEQGDLAEWIDNLAEPGRVTLSLLSLLCAAAALLPDAAGLRLDSGGLRDRRGVLRRGLQDGPVVLLPPRSLFENLTGQGVLWINRTPTISVTDTGRRLRGNSWEAVEEQRGRHRRLWRPVTRRIVSVLVEEARERAIVFALFGNPATGLRRWIEDQGSRLGVPSENLRFVESGHPSVPRYFFCSGNPLGRINDELTARGCDPIDWYGPPARRSAANDSARLSTAPWCTLGRAGTSTIRSVDRILAGTSSARSVAIMDRTAGKYRTALKRLAER